MEVRNPSLDALRALGVRDLAVVCPACGERFAVSLSAIDLPGDTQLANIGLLRPLACIECSASGVIDLQAMGFGGP